MTERGSKAIDILKSSGHAVISEVEPEIAVASQKRAVIWHMYGAKARSKIGGLFGVKLPEVEGPDPRWNDYISAAMVLFAFRLFSTGLRRILLRVPWLIHYSYMLIQKFFLNF